MIRIGIDAMGGDFAPNNVILGAIEACSYIGTDAKIFLIGDETKITEVCRHYGIDSGNFVIVHAPETIEMGEHPVRAFLKKKQSSLVVGFNLLAEGKIDVLASAGNTGAMLTGSVQVLNNIPGIIRPCIPAQIPLADGRNMLLLDVGFNSDARADVLYQFGIMGSIYAKTMMGIEDPKVALLNIGEEAEKGNINAREAYKIMSDSTDFTFVGNICLKQAEGMYGLVAKLGVKHPFFNRFNYETYGGVPVLGVTAPVIIGHGVSTPLAIKNMILQGEQVVRQGLIEKYKKAMLEQ